MTFPHLVSGEMAPESRAIAHPELGAHLSGFLELQGLSVADITTPTAEPTAVGVVTLTDVARRALPGRRSAAAEG